MSLRIAALGLVMGLLGGTANAQNYLPGEDLVNALKNQVQQGINQNQQGINTMVGQAMQDPQCWAAYQQFRAQGGNLPYQTFAYQWLATGRFSAQGKQNYWSAQRGIENQQRQGMEGLRQAEANRAAAIANMQGHYAYGQGQAGLNLQGNRTYTDPNTGTNVVLNYTQPGQWSSDTRTGQNYVMGADGRQYGVYPNGSYYMLPNQ